MFELKRERFVCPHCGKELPEVSNVEVVVSKRNMILSIGTGLGLGLFVSGAWHITWWGALGVAFFAACLAFLVTAATKRG